MSIDEMHWRGWSEDLFQTVKQQNKFVILDLEAIWCRVMEETTYYKDKKVIKLLKQKYITVRVNQDTNSDLLAQQLHYRADNTRNWNPVPHFTARPIAVHCQCLNPINYMLRLINCYNHYLDY